MSNLLPSKIEFAILQMIQSKGEMYGLQLVKEGNFARGSVYVILGRLEEQKWAESRLDDSFILNNGAQRRLYKVTGLGQRAIAAYYSATTILNGDFAIAGV